MNNDPTAKQTTLGIILGTGIVAVLMFYAISNGAAQGKVGSVGCSTCRQAR